MSVFGGFWFYPCGHSVICNDYARHNLLCPFCCDIISDSKLNAIETSHLKPMGLVQEFNFPIIPHVEHKKKNKKGHMHTKANTGMEINGFKKVDFDFNSNETFNEDFNKCWMHWSHIRKTNPRVHHTWHPTPKLILVHLVVLCHSMMCFLGYVSHDCDGSYGIATKDYDGFIGFAYKDCAINELNSSKYDIIEPRLVEQQP